MTLAGAAKPAESGSEIAVKRFGLQVLRAVIETAPPEGDGSKGLPGMWQAGGGAGSGVSVNEGRTGRKVDEEAILLARVSDRVIDVWSISGKKGNQDRLG